MHFFKMLKRHMVISLILHGVLLLLVSVTFFRRYEVKEQQERISVYLADSVLSNKTVTSLRKARRILFETTAMRSPQDERKIQLFALRRPHRGRLEEHPTESSQRRASLLLQLLHTAIAAKQTYPDSALLANQTGTVTIGLTIYPDGHLDNIALLKSSGVFSLDQAAVAAVKAVGVVTAAGHLLTNQQTFSINIVFA